MRQVWNLLSAIAEKYTFAYVYFRICYPKYNFSLRSLCFSEAKQLQTAAIVATSYAAAKPAALFASYTIHSFLLYLLYKLFQVLWRL